MTLAVGTGGASPALAGWLRDRAAAALPEWTGDLARRLAVEREALHAAGGTTEGHDWRRRIEELAAAPTLRPVRSRNHHLLDTRLLIPASVIP